MAGRLAADFTIDFPFVRNLPVENVEFAAPNHPGNVLEIAARRPAKAVRQPGRFLPVS
jgi:hypothetical protein